MAEWATSDDAQLIWADASSLAPDLLTHLLDVSQELCQEYAPVLVDPNPWAASTPYAVGDRVMLTGGTALKCTAAGTSGAVEPVPPGSIGAVVVDGSVTWREISLVPARYKQAVVQQARETWTNGNRDGDVLGFDGDYAIRVRPLADSVKQLLRPQRAVPSFGLSVDEEST